MRKSKFIAVVLLIACMAWMFSACNNAPADGGSSAAPAAGGSSAAVGGSSAAGGSSEAPADGGSSAAAPAPAGEVIEMKLAYTSAPEASTGPLYERFAAKVNADSNGSIHVTTFPSETLVASPETLEAVRNGQADFGHVMIADASAAMPDMTPLEVPGAFPVSKFLEMGEKTRPVVSEIMEGGGVKYLATMNQGSMMFITNGKQVKTPADLKGLSMRTSGKWAAEAIQTWGGSPVTIPLGDVSTALERGTVDGGYCGWVIVVPFGFYEFVEYGTYSNLQAEWASLVMNPASYDKLSDEQKKVIDDAALDFEQYSEELAKENFTKIEQAMVDHGNVLYTLTAEEDAAFTEAVKPLIGKALEATGDNGKALEEILATLR